MPLRKGLLAFLLNLMVLESNAFVTPSSNGHISGSLFVSVVDPAVAASAVPRLTSPQDISSYLDSHDNFLLDCDGVLWAGGAPLPGAVLTVEALRSRGKRVVFITNNSSKSRRQYAAKFAGFGISVQEHDIVTSGSALADFLLKERLKSVYVVGESGLVEELEAVGARCVLEPKDALNSMNEEEFMNLKLDSEVEAVCVGWNRAFNFRHLSVASAYIQQGCRFIGANPDAADRVGKLLFPGTGPLLAAIECASGVAPVVIGKPNPILMHSILQKYGMDPTRTTMVGDRLDTDILFGNAGGVTSTLVLTGVSSEADVATLSQREPSARPNFVMSGLSSLLVAMSN